MNEKVLIVDDLNMFIELQKHFLKSSGVTILTAHEGREAFKICEVEKPSLVCMDFHMPIMNGADCCRLIKDSPLLESTRVILITTEGKETDKSICLASGCDDFLTKPLDKDVFLKAARKLLPAIGRRDTRINCKIRTKYKVFGVTLSGTIIDISQRGLYLENDHEVEKGTSVELNFKLPDPYSASLQLKGQVAWLNTKKTYMNRSLPAGFGVEFDPISDATSRELERFIESEKK